MISFISLLVISIIILIFLIRNTYSMNQSKNELNKLLFIIILLKIIIEGYHLLWIFDIPLLLYAFKKGFIK